MNTKLHNAAMDAAALCRSTHSAKAAATSANAEALLAYDAAIAACKSEREANEARAAEPARLARAAARELAYDAAALAAARVYNAAAEAANAAHRDASAAFNAANAVYAEAICRATDARDCPWNGLPPSTADLEALTDAAAKANSAEAEASAKASAAYSEADKLERAVCAAILTRDVAEADIDAAWIALRAAEVAHDTAAALRASVAIDRTFAAFNAACEALEPLQLPSVEARKRSVAVAAEADAAFDRLEKANAALDAAEDAARCLG